MIKINSINSISFGTTEREVNKKLYSNGQKILNCSYFIRPYESTNAELGDFLANEAKSCKRIEMKVWGCSDLSSFILKKIAMLKKLPPCQFYKILNKIELIDIDKDIIKRAKKGLIGVLDNDFEEVKQTCDIDLKNYLKPLKKDRTFFLNGEPQIASTWIEEEAKFIEQDIKPYRISKHLMRGLKFRTSDIRDDLAQISPPKKGVKRIFDFSNSWYFMKPEAHVKLASKLSEKMNINDIMIIGSTELEHNVAWLLTAFGFKAVENLSGVFKKCKNIPPIEMKNIKKIITNLYIKAY